MGTLVCTIDLDKKKGEGVTVTVANQDDDITQTLSMNGTSITLTVKKGGDQSTITQTFDQVLVEAKTVTVRCTDFEVDAKKTVTVKSGGASSYQSDDTLALQSKSGMSARSTTAGVAIEGSSDVTATGGKTGKVELSGSSAKLSGTGVAIEGKTSTNVKGLTVDVNASTALSMSGSASASLKGGLVTLG